MVEAEPQFSLLQNSPNPFTGTTTITYMIPRPTAVTIAVYDVTGRFVRMLLRRELETGRHSITWDGADASGRPVPAGTYLYGLQDGTDGHSVVRTMTVAR